MRTISSFIYHVICNYKATQEIRGMNIRNEDQLADDTTLLVKDEIPVLKASETINTFSDVTGVRINKNKIKSIWMGQRELLAQMLSHGHHVR